MENSTELEKWLNALGISNKFDSESELRKFKEDCGYVMDQSGKVKAFACTNRRDITKIVLDGLFSELEYLNISGNKGLVEIKFSGTFHNLKHLDISSNEIASLPVNPEAFPALEYLDVSFNKISLGYSFKGSLQKLWYLNLSNNGMEIHFQSGEFPILKYLDLSYNKIISTDPTAKDIDVFPRMPLINTINIRSNRLSEIPIKYNYPELERMDLRENPIKNLQSLSKLFDKEKRFDLYISKDVLKNFTLISDNEEVWELVYKYLERLKKESEISLPIKIIMLGNHASGKSHLVRLLKKGYKVKKKEEKDPDHNDYINSTHVLKTEEYIIKDEIEAYIYDFGGQDFYHGIYNMFMNSNCLFCFVWRSDKNCKEFTLETDSTPDTLKREILNYNHSLWLEQIKQIEGDDNVFKTRRTFIIQSRIDEEKGRQFIGLSSPDIDSFKIIESMGLMLDPKNRTDITTYKYRFDFFKKLLNETIISNKPSVYKSVKDLIDFFLSLQNKFDAKKQDETQGLFIEYEKLVIDINISYYEENKEKLDGDLITLHNIGYIFYYHENAKLKDKIWFYPQAVIDKFRELFHKDFLEDGKIPFEKFKTLGVEDSLVQLFAEKHLLFPHKPDKKIIENFIIPNYLPIFKNDDDYELMEYGMGKAFFYIRYATFIPFGLMSKLITFFGGKPDKKRFWRNALFFTFYQKYKILIKLDLITNEFSFHIIQKTQEEIGKTLKEKFISFLFAVLVNAYKNKELNVLFEEYLDPDLNFDIYEFDYKGIIDFEKDIPVDMYVSLDGENYLLAKDLNDNKSEGKFSMISVTFDDPGKENGQKEGSESEVEICESPKINIGTNLYLREFGVFSRLNFGKTMNIVISYSRDDNTELNRLVSHLRPMERSGKITVFYDLTMPPGIQFSPEIKKRFYNADIIISLVSPGWAKSDFIMKHELPIAMERAETESNTYYNHLAFLIKPTLFQEVVLQVKINGEQKSLNFSDNNLWVDRDKARLVPASQYTPDEYDPYLKFVEYVSELVNKVN